MSDSTMIPAVPVALSRHGTGGGNLSYRQARQVPCLQCEASPCCTHLVLTDFELGSLVQVDHALFLSNFEGILLAIDPDHKVTVYLYQPCGFLEQESGLCTIHSTPKQPAICVQYNAHTCAYRTHMMADVDAIRPLMDHRRTRWLADHTEFDDDRQVVGFPDWSEMLHAFSTMPLERHALPVPPPDPVREQWRQIVLSDKPADIPRPGGRRYDDPKVTSPCQGCEAWCCKLLVFNRGLPVSAANLDFMRYSLGFPGVEIGLSDENWAVIVHTTCRHLDENNLCSVFGTDERPLKCGYYDPLTCTYRGHFGSPNPTDILRVDISQFEVVTDSIVFDELGKILAMPPVDLLRSRLGEFERARSG